VLPCGVALERFHAVPRAQAREALGLDPRRRFLLFPADPSRPEKRHDLALALARDAGVELLVLAGVPPERVALFINASNAVLVPSEREGFGLGVLEALACDVPVLATPSGSTPRPSRRVAGTLCAPSSLESWARRARAPPARGRPARPGPRERGALFRPRRWPPASTPPWLVALGREADRGG
jgi:glycosyltransferase involved in cell wall biosynthesis